MLTRFFTADPWSDLRGDLRFALRGIRRSPAFSLTVVATLALGLGLGAAIFSFADGYLFRPLPFPGSDRTYYVADPHTDIGMLHASDAIALRQSPVNAQFAQMAWPNADPLGSIVRIDGVPRVVVGIVESRKTLLDREPQALVYVPGREADARGPILAWAPGVDGQSLATRLSSAVKNAVAGQAVLIRPASFDYIFARSAGEARFQAPVMAAFGVLAILVAGVGVFGLISYLVEQRRREFGIRMALGARRSDVWRSVVRESVQPTMVGLTLGSVAAYALESIVRSKVFGWQSSGLITIAVVTMGLLVVAVAAALIPAARAARTDPAVTLRAE